MPTEAGIAYVSVEYDPASMSKLRATTQAETQRLASSWGQVGTKLKATGQTLTRSLTLPIVAAGAAATKYTYDFDQSLNHIQALVGASGKQMDQYRSAILALAPAVGQGPDELAKALYFVTSSGFQGAKALEVLRASAKAAASGLGDTQQVADLVTTAVSAYGEKTLSAAHATDVLTEAVKLGKAEPADFVTSLGRVIPVAQAMGVSFGEISGSVAALTLTGQSTEIAVTGLRQVLLNILKPSAEARDALKGVGLSAQELQKVVSQRGIVSALELLNKKFHGNRQEMSKVISNARSLTVAMALIGPNAEKASSTIDQVTNSSGAANKAFQAQSKTMAFQVQQAWATIQTAAVQAGSIILPVFAEIATKVAGVAQEFSKLPDGAQQIVVASTIGVAALGPLLRVMGSMITATKALKVGLIGAQGGFRGLLPLVAANPWIALGAAVSVAAGYFLLTRDNTSEMSRAMDEAKTSTDQLGRALSGLKQSNLDVRQAELDRANAASQLNDANKRVIRDIREGKKGTQEYTRDIREQKQAEVDLGYAKLRVQQTEAQRIAQQDKARKANDDLLKSFSDIGKAAIDSAKSQANYNKALFNSFTPQQKAFKLHQIDTLAVKQYTKHVGDLASQNAELAAGFERTGNPAMAEAKRKATELALAAIDLAGKLGKVPNKKQINVYYKNNMEHLREEARLLAGEIASIPSYKRITIDEIRFGQGHGTPIAQQHPHTGGISTLQGLKLGTGGLAQGGTPGQDSIPALLTPGEMILNFTQQRRLFRILDGRERYAPIVRSGAEFSQRRQPAPVAPVVTPSDTYVTVKIGERDITDIVDTRVERRERRQSRRLTARGAH